MAIVVRVSEKGGEETVFEFQSTPIHIGRIPGDEIVLHAPSVTKHHAILEMRAGTRFRDHARVEPA